MQALTSSESLTTRLYLPLARLAESASEAILAEGLKLNIDAGVVLLDVYQVTTKHAPQYPYLFPVMDPEFTRRCIGQMLAVQARGDDQAGLHEIVAVELREPAPRLPQPKLTPRNRCLLACVLLSSVSR